MPVIAIAVMLALTVPLCAKEKREWQDGVVLDVSPPSGRRASNTPPNPTGSATQMGGGTPSVPVLESTAGREIWIWFISVKGHTYAAGYDRPRARASSAPCAAGSRSRRSSIIAMCTSSTPKGKEWKLVLVGR